MPDHPFDAVFADLFAPADAPRDHQQLPRDLPAESRDMPIDERDAEE